MGYPKTSGGIPHRWRCDGLPRAEMDARRDAWNAAVDGYVAADRGSRDTLASSRASKIDWHGGPLYATCGNPPCAEVEAAPGAFAACARCGVVRYCGRACQKAAWKPHHKARCGSASEEPRLPSEVAVDRALSADCHRALA